MKFDSALLAIDGTLKLSEKTLGKLSNRTCTSRASTGPTIRPLLAHVQGGSSSRMGAAPEEHRTKRVRGGA